MLFFGFCALSIAVGLGGALAAGRFRRAAVAHGVAGLAGLGAITLALDHGGFRGAFAWDAVVLAAGAALGGIVLYGLGRGRRARPGLLVTLHAMAGGLAYVLLAGFVFGH